MTESDPQTEAPALGWTYQRIATALEEVSDEALHRTRLRLEAGVEAEMQAQIALAEAARVRLEAACGGLGHIWRKRLFGRPGMECTVCLARAVEGAERKEDACSSAT